MDSRMGKQDAGVFSRWAMYAARALGSAKAFALALGIVLFWALSGPVFHFSDTWQLIINTGTTIVTFLMVFLVQHTQNRDSAAIQLKLDEMIRSTQGAHNALLDLEDLGTEDLDKIRALYQDLAQKARTDKIKDLAAHGTPDITLTVFEQSRRRHQSE
ncbi:MAG TPA: low affinity iron permease family protein [Nitrospiraceae bacterium]|nr:low affinity iron permease family protein [Nitrospiraceae bacterium]